MKKNRIKRNDYNRSLITETLPFETPIIFSNDGLYDQISTLSTANVIQKTIIKALVLGEGYNWPAKPTIPYLYKVRKNSNEFRRLALLHPLSQWRIKCFYQRYEHLLLHYCIRSPASIRAPCKIAGSFYSKSSWENINKYKNNAITLTSLDKFVKHTPSFFSYSGYDRLYKFFNSTDYFALEKQFSVLSTLDVSKCFDSIYTHSLSWAVKDKEFTKSNVDVSSTFAQDFDQVIRHGNHNETNGIPIGPEASRIFAEIIFQEIDRRVIVKVLELKGLKFGADYAFRRYVDDVFIFSDGEKTAEFIYAVYADVLVEFNLHANTSKSAIYHRPFLTTKSRLIFEAGLKVNEFFGKFLEESEERSLTPKRIFSQWKLIKSHIDSIKSLCSYGSASYDEVASFLISVITERIKRLVSNDLTGCTDEDAAAYLAALEVLIDVIFFLYSVAPSVGASYKLSTSLILAFRFSEQYLPEHSESVSQRLYSQASTLLLEQCGKPHAEGVEGFVHLEYLNIVLAIRELGDFHLLPQRVINELFIKDKKLSYFTIVSCLFYVRGDDQYKSIRRKILKSASLRLGNLADVLINSEKAYLLLDMLSCPFVSNGKKAAWIKSLHTVLKMPQPSATELAVFLSGATSGNWQVDWSDVDLLNSLEKKELKQAY